jgi:hypothetical protein
MLEWKYQTGNAVLFESTVDKTKFTFMLSENTIVKSIEKTEESTEKSIEKEESTEIGIEKLSKNTETILNLT